MEITSSNYQFSGATVDGSNPTPVDLVDIPLSTGFHTCWVVQDFFHQQYLSFREGTWRIIPLSKWLVTTIYKPFRPFVRGTTLLRGLTNHGY